MTRDEPSLNCSGKESFLEGVGLRLRLERWCFRQDLDRKQKACSAGVGRDFMKGVFKRCGQSQPVMFI